MAASESSLDLSDRTPEDIVAVLSNHIRTLLEAIQLNQLFVLVNHESYEVGSDLVLSLSNCTLALVCKSFMSLLKFLESLQLCTSLLWGSSHSISLEFSES